MLQARRLGKELLVGIHSDEAILANKGPTVMTLKERWVMHDRLGSSAADPPYQRLCRGCMPMVYTICSLRAICDFPPVDIPLWLPIRRSR